MRLSLNSSKLISPPSWSDTSITSPPCTSCKGGGDVCCLFVRHGDDNDGKGPYTMQQHTCDIIHSLTCMLQRLHNSKYMYIHAGILSMNDQEESNNNNAPPPHPPPRRRRRYCLVPAAACQIASGPAAAPAASARATLLSVRQRGRGKRMSCQRKPHPPA